MISTTVISYSEKQSTIGSTCHMKDRIPTGSRLSHLNSRSLTESGQLCLFQFICVTFLSPPLPTLPFWHLCLCDCNTPNPREVGIHSCPPPPVAVAPSLSHVQLCGTPWTIAHQIPLSMGFSRQEHWSGCRSFSEDLEGLNPYLPHRRQMLYNWAPQGALPLGFAGNFVWIYFPLKWRNLWLMLYFKTFCSVFFLPEQIQKYHYCTLRF